MDDELEHSPRSWLDDFTQRFSWCRLSAQALPFLNNYFLPGVREQSQGTTSPSDLVQPSPSQNLIYDTNSKLYCYKYVLTLGTLS